MNTTPEVADLSDSALSDFSRSPTPTPLLHIPAKSPSSLVPLPSPAANLCRHRADELIAAEALITLSCAPVIHVSESEEEVAAPHALMALSCSRLHPAFTGAPERGINGSTATIIDTSGFVPDAIADQRRDVETFVSKFDGGKMASKESARKGKGGKKGTGKESKEKGTKTKTTRKRVVASRALKAKTKKKT